MERERERAREAKERGRWLKRATQRIHKMSERVARGHEGAITIRIEVPRADEEDATEGEDEA
jgi:hypothetical protein